MSPDGELLVKILVLASLVGQGVSIWVGITRRKETRRIEPSPLEVVPGKVFATRDELNALNVQIAELRAQRDSDVSSLRSEINKVSIQLASISANAESTKSTLAMMASKLDRLVERRFSNDPTA